jgi:hypothetical protein
MIFLVFSIDRIYIAFSQTDAAEDAPDRTERWMASIAPTQNRLLCNERFRNAKFHQRLTPTREIYFHFPQMSINPGGIADNKLIRPI